MRLSLREQGYLLGVPEDVGDESGLSNSATIRHFFANDVLPSLRTSQLKDFTPHQNQYEFANGYSRAYRRPSLSLRLYELKDSLEDAEIRPGKRYGPGLAEATLNRNKLVEELIRFRESSNEQDVLKYIASGQIVDGLEKVGLFTQKEFLNDLMKISINPARSFSVRKKAFFEILLVTSRADATIFPDFQEFRFSDAEKSQMNSEVRQWKSSSDKRKNQFANGINEMWFKAAREGNETFADALSSLRLVEINLDLFSNFLNIPYSTDHARIHSFFLSHPRQRGSQASLAVLSKLTDLLWKSPEGQAWFARHPDRLRLLKSHNSHNRQLIDHIVVQNWKTVYFNLGKADDRQILMRVVAQTESIEKLQDVIYLKIRKNTPEAQIAFVSELATSSICSLFCRELLTSLFIHSGQLGLEYDTSVFKREGHNLPIDNSVRTAVLRTSNLSESELNSLVYLKTPKSASAADFLKMLKILESKFNIFGQNLADLPILNLAEKIDLFTQMEKIADSDLKANSKLILI
ncbi:MAG: hypothetical protein IPJ71_11990 [Bdellovibrionales bacterium]|nr:hypothetical protein [Bdellovibrionales bacterium]